MRVIVTKSISRFMPLFLIFCFAACSHISPFSPFAYEQSTSLKVESLNLMSKASEPYADCSDEIEAIKIKIEKAYEYAKGQPKNELSAKQWQILMDPERNLLGGFLERWKAKSTLSDIFIREAKGVVADAFNTIIGLESGKIKESEVK